MLVADEGRFGCVLFGKDQMTNDAKTGLFPGTDKGIDAVPTVKLTIRLLGLSTRNISRLAGSTQSPWVSLAIERPERSVKPTRYGGSVKMKSILAEGKVDMTCTESPRT